MAFTTEAGDSYGTPIDPFKKQQGIGDGDLTGQNFRMEIGAPSSVEGFLIP